MTDHESTDNGWNAWALDEHFAYRAAAGEYTPASNALSAERVWRAIGEDQQDDSSIERADRHLLNAIYLAAAEAKLKGYEIIGWDSAAADEEVSRFYNAKVVGYTSLIALREASEARVTINGWQELLEAA